jgi:hypothetical protein
MLVSINALSRLLRIPSVLVQTALHRIRQFTLIVGIAGQLNSAYSELSLKPAYILTSLQLPVPDGVNLHLIFNGTGEAERFKQLMY